MHPTINKGEIRLALTSGYGLDVRTLLSEAQLAPLHAVCPLTPHLHPSSPLWLGSSGSDLS